MDSNEIIAARLRALQKVLNVPRQNAFAKIIGVEKNTYNGYVKGKKPLSFETACLIRRKYGVPVDWLFFGAVGHISQELLVKAEGQAEAELTATAAKPKRTRKAG